MKNLLSFIVIAITLYSCNLGANAIYKSDNIESELKSEIESLNKKFFKALIDKDKESIESLMSSTLLEEMIKPNASISFDDFLKYGESLSVLQDYQTVDEFLVKGTANTSSLIPYQLTSTNDYNINFKSLTSESYVSLVKMKGERSHCVLFTFVYGKYNNQWKINIFHIGDYSLHDHTAPYYYEKAKTEYDQANLINSFINMHLTSSTLKSGGQVFSYNIEKDAIELENKIMNAINNSYKFPVVLEEIESKPEIFAINPQEIEHTFSPMVRYLTKINLRDTLLLRLENEKIRWIIPKYFKGINENNDFVCYKAFNEIPDGSKSVPTYGFVDYFKTK